MKPYLVLPPPPFAACSYLERKSLDAERKKKGGNLDDSAEYLGTTPLQHMHSYPFMHTHPQSDRIQRDRGLALHIHSCGTLRFCGVRLLLVCIAACDYSNAGFVGLYRLARLSAHTSPTETCMPACERRAQRAIRRGQAPG